MKKRITVFLEEEEVQLLREAVKVNLDHSMAEAIRLLIRGYGRGQIWQSRGVWSCMDLNKQNISYREKTMGELNAGIVMVADPPPPTPEARGPIDWDQVERDIKEEQRKKEASDE
jgi:hypothetical protein